jgi:HTH-type transcriptional regulator/antitoxin HigA
VVPCIIKTAAQHRQALGEIERLTEAAPAPRSPAAERLELLVKLVGDHENAQFALACPDPLAAIRSRMQQRGLRQKDLAPMLGGRNRVSEILAGKRSLTVAMIRELSRRLDIPAELLIREPVKPPAAAARG